MSSVNKVILVGNLTRDPEVKTFGNGGKIANLGLATSDKWTDKSSGERKEKTEFHNVTLNGDGLVGVAERLMKKGSKVYIEGKLQTRKWQDAQGNDRYTTEVVVSGFGGSMVMLDGPNAGTGQRGGGNESPRQNAVEQGGWNDELDDVPFASNDFALEWRVR